MKTNPEALKALYVAAGGDASAVADAVTSVDVLNKIAVLFGGVGTATTNPDAIDNITAVYSAGFEPVSQIDKYNSNKFAAYTDGAVLVVGGLFKTVDVGDTEQETFVNVKAAKGKTLTKVFDYAPGGYTIAVTGEKVSVTNSGVASGSPAIIAIYAIS